MTVLQDLYQIFWNPPASYVHLLVHTIGWTAIVVAVYSYMMVVIHSSRAKRRQRRFLAGVAQVRKQPDRDGWNGWNEPPDPPASSFFN